MSLFTIDQKKCKRDGICAAECPAQIIVQPDKKSFPSLLENGEDFCINCGHCVAVCPHEAFKLATMPLAGCSPVVKDLMPDPGSLKHFLLSRRSIRQYKKTPVSRKLLAELIDAARYAPSASNRQQVRWMVFENPADVRKLALQVVDFTKLILPGVTDQTMARRLQRVVTAWDNGRDRIMRGAPHLILVYAQADLPYAETDCVIALTYLELYAFAKGLGTCWAGYFTGAASTHAPLIKELDLPPGHQCYGAVMLGYPQYRYSRIPKRNDAQVAWR